jgi:hypothetical protein
LPEASPHFPLLPLKLKLESTPYSDDLSTVNNKTLFVRYPLSLIVGEELLATDK